MRELQVVWITLFVILCAVADQALANTRDICARDPPDTEASKTPGDNGFRIKIAGRPTPDKYTPGQVYTITINGTYPNQKLLGFMLVAVPLNAQDESTMMGTFQHLNSGLTKFADACYWVVQHTYRHPKAGAEVLWTAPPAGTGCIEFRATVIEYKDIWYKDDGALTRVFCEDTGVTENEQPAAMLPECCACGSAKYQITFHGLWSRQTHPVQYPEHNKALLHWSNIVGASHSSSYVPWQYGTYASEGVKQVCEFGYVRKMEEEMRTHSRDVRTVIKTPGIWWKDPEGLQQTRWARFSVDRRHHLLTMLTMIGPSPDWCVGVSGLSLCLPNCTWAGDRYIDLYPWDSGTDEGMSYMSANQKSDPPQKIHRITNTFPNNPKSPFHGEQPIRPLGRIELKRLHPKPGAAVVCTGEEEDEDFEDAGFETSEDIDFESLSDMEKKKLMMMKSGKCGVSDWTPWSDCSVTCGVGDKFRKRMYLNPMVDEAMCGLPTMEKENCIGLENECGDVAPGCEATQWSSWSPCSVTCGKGVQDRRRVYLNKQMGMKCDRSMDEQQMCAAEIMDCEKARMMANFTVICAQPKKVGSCRGGFLRWYYDSDMQKCLPFNYTGCRGNENRFRTPDECMDMCLERIIDMARKGVEFPMAKESSFPHFLEKPLVDEKDEGEIELTPEEIKKHLMVKQQMMERQERLEKERMMEKQRQMEKDANAFDNGRPVIEFPQVGASTSSLDCMMSPWTSWSQCSATCGRSYKYKRRMVKREPVGDGKRCPKRLEKKKKCDVPKCAQDCELGEWSEWTPCLHTCLQERTRQVLHRPRRGGAQCGARLSRRDCYQHPCQKKIETAGSYDQKKRRRRRRRH